MPLPTLPLVSTDDYPPNNNNNDNGNNIDIDVWLNMLTKHYEKLAATYKKKGMPKEAEVFSDVFEKFTTLNKTIDNQEKSKKLEHHR